MEGSTHKHVVDLIKKGGDKLTLVVISVSEQEAEKLDSESSSGGEYYDYSDKRLVPVSIPETRQVTQDGETYVVRSLLSTCQDFVSPYLVDGWSYSCFSWLSSIFEVVMRAWKGGGKWVLVGGWWQQWWPCQSFPLFHTIVYFFRVRN